MSKLISVGCSFTNWHFPTVPDWLGYCFDEYENLGKEGAGNRYIFNQLFNYIQDNDISDTFFYIQWTGIPRRDWMGVGNEHWNTLGTFNEDDELDDLSELNLLQFSTEFRNYLYTTKTHFDSFNIPYIMNHMLDPWFDGNLGEPGIGTVPNHIYKEGIKLINNSTHLDDIKKISKDNFLEPCLEFFSIDNKNKEYGHIALGQESEPMQDYHMNPMLCLKYAREVVYPRLKDMISLESIFDKKLDKLSEEWLESLKNPDFMKQHRILHDRREFQNYLHPYPWNKEFKKMDDVKDFLPTPLYKIINERLV